MLSRLLDDAIAGHGKVVLIGGAAGVGKTRMAAEVGAEAQRKGAMAYVGSCRDRKNPDPFTPFVEILESALAQASSPAAFRDALDKDANEMAWYLPRLRRLFPDIPPPPQNLPPGQSRRMLFGAVAELIQRTSRNKPMLLLLDDLQWADEGSLALLNHLAQLVPEMRVLIVGTYRDFGLDPSIPLTQSLDELIRRHLVERINLGGLSQDSVGAMLRALSGTEPPGPVVRLFYSYTEGNPFFVEELFRHLAEQRKLIDPGGEFRRGLRFDDLDVPQSLRLLIGRRFMALSDVTQKTLATAAVVGRSFTFELLAASTATDTDLLLDSVEEAERAGLISSTLHYPEARFRFSHELIRQAVAQTLSLARRQRLHLDIANAIERVYAETLEDHANDLAYHLWEAGSHADPGKAVHYIGLVARYESQHGALTESEGHYLQALTALEMIPPSEKRDEQELVLQLGLGSVSIATRGYVDSHTEAAFDRASSLAERLGNSGQVVLALTGSFAVPLLRGETEATQVLAEKVCAASDLDGRPLTRIWGQMLQGVSRYQRGDLAGAYKHLGQAVSLYVEEDHRGNAQDPVTDSLEYLALSAWHLGMADEARARMKEAVALASRLAKPFVLAHNRFFAAYLCALMREPEKALEFAEAAIEYSREQQIPLFYDASRVLCGWALVERGKQREGLTMAHEGLASYRDAGSRNGIGSFMAFLAEAQARCASVDDGLTTVNEGIAASQKQRVDLPQLYWLRVELMLHKTTSKVLLTDAAEASFREALAMALEIGSKAYALRSATGLGRLLAKRGQAAASRELIRPIVESFSEGFDTRDWLDAKAVLDASS